jgi:hypothetical protein
MQDELSDKIVIVEEDDDNYNENPGMYYIS